MYIYTVHSYNWCKYTSIKNCRFSIFSNPIALGTILFSSTFLTTDILSEYYGVKYARKNILIGFISFLIMTIFMLFTIGFSPLSLETAAGDQIILGLYPIHRIIC